MNLFVSLMRPEKPINAATRELPSAQFHHLGRGLRDKELNNPVLIFIGFGEPLSTERGSGWHKTISIPFITTPRASPAINWRIVIAI